MNKKLFISLAIIISVIFSFTICFANDNGSGLKEAANGVRNFVGGVENTVEDAAKDVSNTSKNITGGMENGMSEHTDRNSNASHSGMGSTDDHSRYTTARVNTGDTTVLGMSSTAWTWLIVGIAAIAIIALIWYYSMQFANNNHHNDE